MQKEVELKEKELQMQYTMKELELKGKDVLENKEPHTAVAKECFDFTRHVKMVPSFQEHEVDKFFLHFENLHWPSGARTMLLQSVLIGKAREVYSALSVEQSTDYDRSFMIQNVRKERRTVCDIKKLTFRFLYNCKNIAMFPFFRLQKNDYTISRCTHRNYAM